MACTDLQVPVGPVAMLRKGAVSVLLGTGFTGFGNTCQES